MCIEVFYYSKVKVAGRNIKVYKRLLQINPYNLNEFMSPFQRVLYTLKKPKLAKKDFTKSVKYFKSKVNSYNKFSTYLGNREINSWDTIGLSEGLHSYTCEETAWLKKCHREVLCEAIIPKGAKYIKGDFDEVLSNALIVRKVLRR